MSMRGLWLASMVLAGGVAQAQIAREGRHWVETVTGGTDVDSALKVTTRGAIALQGENRADVAYVIKKRAAARSDQQARAMLSKVSVKTYRQKNWVVLAVYVPAYFDGSADVQLRVPKKLKEVALDSEGGALEAYDLDGSLLAQTGSGPVQVDRVWGWVKAGTGGGTVKIGKVGGLLKGYSGGGSIYVDSVGGEAFLDTGGGEIVVREARGHVQARAGGGGNIRIERADGGAVVSTGGGLIDVLHSDGPVHANTGSGGVRIRSAGNIEVVSGAGQIQLRAVHGPVQATTAVGSIIAELEAGRQIEDSQLITQSGDITVYIPSKFAVTIDATNTSPGSYRIVSEFPEVRSWLEGGNTRSRAHGALNGGGPLLRLAASGGTIYLRRRE